VNRVLRLLVVGAIGIGLLLTPAALADTRRVKATANDKWDPDFRHITKGDRIVWKNPARHDQVHNVKAYSNNWNKFETLSPGESTRKRFRRRGTYKYRCTLHSDLDNGQCSGMCGIIHVTR
jgi:plastocyanin